MATKFPWFRLYTEILDDKKIKRVCRVTGESKALVIGVWVILLTLASDSDERGLLYISDDTPYTIDDLSAETGLDEDALVTVLNEFTKLGMLAKVENETLQISKWNDRQYKSDVSSARVKKHRETLHNRYSNGDVTPPESDTESDTDTELINDSAREKEFSTVWEKETGTPISNAYQFFQMLDEFKKVGVTPEIYRQAIQEQKQSNYAVNSPTSVKTWAIGMVTQKRDQRRQSDNGKRPAKVTTDDNERIAKEVMDEYLATQRR